MAKDKNKKSKPRSGMDTTIEQAMSTMYGFDKDGNPVYAGKDVSSGLTEDSEDPADEDGETHTATGELYSEESDL